MTNIKLDYVHSFVDRHGKPRHYLRLHGRRVPLPGLPGSTEFMAAYQAGLDDFALPRRDIGASRTGPGTISAMIIGYLGSGAFQKGLRESSQQQYRYILEGLRREHGDKRMAKLERRQIVHMLDAKAATPSAARNLLRCLRALVQYAISIEVREDDPTADIKVAVPDDGGHPTWSEAEIAAFEAKFPIGTKPRLAEGILLYTVQRCSDVVGFGQPSVCDGALHFTQVKRHGKRKPKPMIIPVRQELQAILDATPTVGITTWLVNERGQPFTARAFSKWFAKRCRDAGLPHLSAHGLRKAAMRRMAEDGWTEKQMAAWSGHDSLREIARYTEAANQERMARDALRTNQEHQAVANLAGEAGKPSEKSR